MTKAAAAGATTDLQGIDKLATTTIDPTTTLSATKSQASSLADDRGEDDATFFSRRPDVNSRKRLCFEGEPPPGLLEPDDSVAFISVRLERDAAGWPATITREIAYGQWGTA
jgi:hypothetical protein